MRAAAGLQRVVRPRQTELAQEYIGHLVIIVLTGVDDRHVEAIAHARKRVPQRGDFHEIGPRARDEVNSRFHRIAIQCLLGCVTPATRPAPQCRPRCYRRSPRLASSRSSAEPQSCCAANTLSASAVGGDASIRSIAWTKSSGVVGEFDRGVQFSQFRPCHRYDRQAGGCVFVELERIDASDEVAMVPDVERNEADRRRAADRPATLPKAARPMTCRLGSSGSRRRASSGGPIITNEILGRCRAAQCHQLEIEPFRHGAHIDGARLRYRRVGRRAPHGALRNDRRRHRWRDEVSVVAAGRRHRRPSPRRCRSRGRRGARLLPSHRAWRASCWQIR